MPGTPLAAVVRHLRHVAAPAPPESDGALLRRFAAGRDEAAFASLVRRHGPLVLGVCRRVLRDAHDVEDAFQATFFVLARKAGSVRRSESLAGWLYRVAYRVAGQARAERARRRLQERLIHDMRRATQPAESAAPTWDDLCPILDEELQALPDKYRLPVVLCHLQGRTLAQAAAELGWPRGTVAGRLARARDLLRVRLARRGVAPSAALLGTLLAEGTASAAVPAALAGATAKEAALFAAGTAPASLRVALAEAVLRATGLTKLRTAAALLLGLAILAVSPAVPARPAAPPEDAPASAPAAAAPRADIFGDALPAGVLARMGTVRLRHPEGVVSMVFTPDGKTLISGSYDGTLRQWSLADGREVRHFDGHEGAVLHLAISGDGKLLAAWGEQPSGVSLWEVATGKALSPLLVPVEGQCVLTWAPDNRTLAVGGPDGSVRLWDVKTGRELRSVAAHKPEVKCLAFSPDGKRLASAGRDGTIRLIDVAGKEEPRTLRAREKEYHFVTFSRDGKLLISGGDCYADNISAKVPWVNTVAVWDAATGQRQRDFRVGDDQDGDLKGAPSVALAPDGTTLALGYWDHTIRLWDLATGKPLRKLTEFPDHFYPAYHVAFAPDGRTLAAAGSHNAVCLLDVATGKRLLKDGPAQERDIRSVALSADGRLLATGSPDQTVILWDAATGRPRRELRGHDGWVYAVALTSDARTVVSGSSDGTVRLWDAATGKELRKLSVPFELPKPFLGSLRVGRVAVSPDGKLLASSHTQSGPGMVLNGPGGIRLWDAATGKELRRLEGNIGEPCFLAFSADGKALMAANSDRSLVCLWDVATGKELRRCDPLGGQRVREVSVTADGRLAVFCAFGGQVTLWDVATGRGLLTIQRPGNHGYVPAFTADGKFLALAGAGYRGQGQADGRTVELWELASGRMVCQHALPPGNGVVSAAVSADGRTLATGTYDTTTLTWDLAPVPPRGAPRKAEDLWAALAGEDAATAYRAMTALTATPEEAVAFLGRRLRPAAAIDRRRTLALIADLDSAEFDVRERASAALEELGPEAESVFAEVLGGRPSAEVRRRVEALRAVSPLPIRRAEGLRCSRALVVLERIGTAEARKVLEALAAGAPAAPQTAEAKAALGRLPKRQR